MPYPTIDDLPPAVRHPPSAAACQEIFCSAFNNAWQSYAFQDPQRHEETAFRVAWAAVKKTVRKGWRCLVPRGW
jgi:cation transport regulator